MIDLARLNAGTRDKAAYQDPYSDVEVVLYFCHATPGMLGAAMKAGGVDLAEAKEQGEDIAGGRAMAQNDQLIGMDIACLELACMSIERVTGIDAWPDQCRDTGDYGLPTLTASARAKLDRIALLGLGRYLLEKSEVSDEEGKDSEPSPSPDS